MADTGYIALFLAFIVSLYSAVSYASGTRGRRASVLMSARNGLIAVCGLVTLATGVMLYALISHQFQLEYVHSYTSRDLSLPYLISALWAGQSGSLLFWAWLLSVLALIATLQRRDIGRELVPYAAMIMMVTEAFLLIILVFVSNPFQQLPFTPADGRGLNPLLENPGMFIHPPLLLMGYVGFAIPFAFAMSALLTRRLGDEWLVTVRRWTLITWLVLGAGNLIGSWWAYVELGWGGYWAWDPVENAGLMPWLVSTAFLHSMMMQRRRGILKKWNMVLVILTFVLAIFGTFLTRSGVLASVHSFGESNLGPFFLAFIGVSLVGSLLLLYYRSEDLASEAEMESLVSRESTFLLNNLLLVGAAFAVFLGTVFPVISEAVRGVKISVGPPFFNQVNGPIFVAIILLAGICTLIGWRRASIKNLLHNFLWPVVAAVLTAIVLFIAGIRESYALIAVPICVFVLMTILSEWFRGTKARHQTRGENYPKAFWRLMVANRPRYGGYLVHIAVLLIALGVVGSSLFNVEKEVTMKNGDSVTLGKYSLTLNNMDQYDTASKQVVTASLAVYNSGHMVGTLTPEKYFQNEQAVTEVAIRSTLREDLYAILVGWDDNGATFKFLVNPLVAWIWLGGVVMMVGGLFAFWPASAKKERK